MSVQRRLNFGRPQHAGVKPPVDVRSDRVRVVASVSGGRDSAAASLFLTDSGIKHTRVFMDTGWEHELLYTYLRGVLTDALGPIEEIRGELDEFDCWVWRPIIDWHAADVEAIHDEHGLEMNPLYYLGAKRVGCWPCIHERKEGIAIVAKHDPGRIDLIDATERELNEAGAAKDAELGREFVTRSMFSYHGGDSKHYALPIRNAVDWARSKRGEWQPEGEDSCARWGLCSAATEEPEPSSAPLFDGVAP